MKPLSVVSFNFRFPCENDGKNYFFKRLPMIAQAIEERKPDLIGAQELTDASRAALVAALDGYALVGGGRNADRHGEGVALLYRTDRFSIEELDTVWLSDTPHLPGSRYEGADQSPCPRVLLSALLVPHEEEMSPFRVYVAHTDHVGARARVLASHDMLARIGADAARERMPYILMGDLNAEPTAPEIRLLSESQGLTDVTDKIKVTFHAWHTREGFAGSKIDYIYVSEEFSHQGSFLWTENRDGVYLSDHYPVEARLLL